jgi:hypothetical protein
MKFGSPDPAPRARSVDQTGLCRRPSELVIVLTALPSRCSQRTYLRRMIEKTTLCALCTMMPIQALR